MQKTAQPKIVFLAEGFINWTGGVDFLRLCIKGIDTVVRCKTWPVLVPRANILRRGLAFAGATKRRLWSMVGRQPGMGGTVSREELHDAVSSTGCSTEIIDYPFSSKGLADAMRRLDADIVLPCIRSPGAAFTPKWVGYIADLQHKRLPGNFDQRECLERDRIYETLLADAQAIIVNSRSAIHDIEEFYPERRATLFALPFCPPANPDFLNDSGADMLHSYDLPRRFFIISNQFWVHKSHLTAFAALRLVRDAGFGDVHILCTGNMHDYRVPGHLDRLKADIERDGLSDRIRFLGVIPKRHQLAMMRRSIAVVQPTLFEGGPGGGSVYDAVSTATPAIISDIHVNREVDCGVIEFFRAGSVEDLAQKMLGALKNPPQRLSAETTLAMLRDRQQRMGEALLQAISFVTNSATSVAPDHG